MKTCAALGLPCDLVVLRAVQRYFISYHLPVILLSTRQLNFPPSHVSLDGFAADVWAVPSVHPLP